MSEFSPAVKFVLLNEKELSENPHDHGKITKWGISLRFLKSLESERLRFYDIFDDIINEDTIRALTLEQVESIYHREFWLNAPFAKIRNQEHCNYIFDMAVNLGINPAIKCVQRACWSVMKRRELVDDGILGDRTLDAIERCGFLIMPPIRSERAGYYRLITQQDETQDKNLQGWLNRAYEAN